ncbi:hypothetical protein BJ875DRAFT_160691 [Amylocarpus encephaloides]|uniref:PCI domain-containing protein n=1 Tax=Amylocarpus encephaloides TaxID=45428 RepID=A0A9P7YPJ6_9HELO|nr:hypothetical protein BJ875DRAFT_160691 [Amylocarpus encephaloides]
MEQTKALNALEPFLALTKSASSPRAAADLIARATSAPNTFIFSELLDCPQIQSLSTSTEYSSHLTLLEIFSHGTYASYQSTTPALPTLNDAQLLKLRQLSFLSLAKNPADLSYSNLLSALGLGSPRELEDLVISAIYAGLLTATLDPYNQLIAISSVSPLRDLRPNSIPSMLSTLDTWSARCSSTLADLEAQMAALKTEAARRHKAEQEWSAEVEVLLEKAGKDAEKNQGGGLGFGNLPSSQGMGVGMMGANDTDEDDMDIDDDEEDTSNQRSTRSAKKRGFGTLGGK